MLEWRTKDGLTWLEWQAAGVTAAFPSRAGGRSAPPFASLNLGLLVGDDAADVLENRRRWTNVLGLSLDRVVVPLQVHGTSLREVGEAEAGRGARDQASVIAGTDALLTGAPGLALAISSADCVPVVIAAEGSEGPLLATVHAGWRGMLAGLVGQAAVELGRRGRLLAAAVGPSIGPCCFTVDERLEGSFEERFPGSGRGGTVDLWDSARQDLVAAGVPVEKVAVSRVCTSSDARFYSHRRDHGTTGRHLALAWRQEA